MKKYYLLSPYLNYMNCLKSATILIKKLVISRSDYQACIFDLDGVVTTTARLHPESWKELFDQFLREKHGNERFSHFSIETDYRHFVDGMPRYRGVKSFLDSRGIALPLGNEDDSPEAKTVCGLGNPKNRIFNQNIQQKGVEEKLWKAGADTVAYDLGVIDLRDDFQQLPHGLTFFKEIRKLFEEYDQHLDFDRQGYAASPATRSGAMYCALPPSSSRKSCIGSGSICAIETTGSNWISIGMRYRLRPWSAGRSRSRSRSGAQSMSWIRDGPSRISSNDK